MAYTLADIEALKNDPIRSLIVKGMTDGNPVLQRVPWVHSADRTYTWVEDGELPTVGFAAIGGGYQKSTGDYEQKSVALRIMGSDAPIPRFLIDTNGGAMEDLEAGAARKASRALGLLFADAFINGRTNASPAQFDGLSRLIPSSHELETGEDGLAINGATEAARYDFLDQLVKLVGSVEGRPDALFMNSQALSAIKSVGLRLGAVVQSVDEFGRTVSTFDNIPMLDVGVNANKPQTQIIGNTEVQGEAENCTSIYAVKFGEDAVHAVGTGSYFRSVNLGESEVKPEHTVRVDGYVALVRKGNSAAVLRGVIA